MNTAWNRNDHFTKIRWKIKEESSAVPPMHRYSLPKRRRGPLPPVRWPYGSHRPIYKGRLKGTAWLFRPVGTADHLPYIARPYGYDLPCMWGRWMHIYGNQTKSRIKILYVFPKRMVVFGTLLEHYVLYNQTKGQKIKNFVPKFKKGERNMNKRVWRSALSLLLVFTLVFTSKSEAKRS